MITNSFKHVNKYIIEAVIEQVYDDLTFGDEDKRWKVSEVAVAAEALKRCNAIEAKMAAPKQEVA